MNRILVLDVCGTLFGEDTTIGLLSYHFSSNSKLRYLLLISLTDRRSPVSLAVKVLEAISRQHFLKLLLVRMLKGEHISNLQESANEYVDGLLAHGKVLPVWDLIDGRLGNYSRVLASGSIRPVVEVVSEKLGVPFVASELEAVGDVYTGRYSDDISGKKPAYLSDVIGSANSLRPYTAISDNLSDMNLLAGAEQAFVVVHKARHLRRWNGLSATYIRLF